VNEQRAWERVALGLLAASCLCSCAEPAGSPTSPSLTAQFGVFYGGQVQERERIALELDQTRQTQGFRLELVPAPREALEVRWELGMPAAGRIQKDSQGRRARPRLTQLGVGRFRPGESRFEQSLAFAPGDPLGLWNIRVLVGSRVALDRPFWVYDQRQLERRERVIADSDAGL
jgi:hypothetical protein